MTTPTYTKENAGRLCPQEWPELPRKRQDIRGPAKSGPPGMLSETLEWVTKKTSSYAATCEKQLSSRTNSFDRIGNSNLELFFEAQAFPQEVCDETGSMWSFTKIADSLKLPDRASEDNLIEKDFRFSHLQSTKMEKGVEDTRDSADGESDSSWLLALQELSNCVGEAAVDTSQHSE